MATDNHQSLCRECDPSLESDVCKSKVDTETRQWHWQMGDNERNLVFHPFNSIFTVKTNLLWKHQYIQIFVCASSQSSKCCQTFSINIVRVDVTLKLQLWAYKGLFSIAPSSELYYNYVITRSLQRFTIYHRTNSIVLYTIYKSNINFKISL
jgi:hypothetical protein